MQPCPQCGRRWKQLTPGHVKLTHKADCPRHPKNRAPPRPCLSDQSETTWKGTANAN